MSSNPSEREAMYYHALAHACQANLKRLAAWRERYGTWEHAWRARGNTLFKTPAPEELWRKLALRGIALLLKEDSRYPALLRHIPDPPLGIYARGNLGALHGAALTGPALAIVGTRKATQEGSALARRFAGELSACGIRIVSGLAFGIDAAAHKGALDGGGITIAVLANGLHEFFPPSHAGLGAKILAAGGAAISEYPPGMPALKQNFLARNRIVSGISQAALIIEAPEHSGALVTARLAAEQGRDVMVVPGPPEHPNYRGSHGLIREGAELVVSVEQIMRTLKIEMRASGSEPAAASGASRGAPPASRITPPALTETPEMKIILRTLRTRMTPLHIDKIAELTNLNIQTVAENVVKLMLAKRVRERNGGYLLQ